MIPIYHLQISYARGINRKHQVSISFKPASMFNWYKKCCPMLSLPVSLSLLSFYSSHYWSLFLRNSWGVSETPPCYCCCCCCCSCLRDSPSPPARDVSLCCWRLTWVCPASGQTESYTVGQEGDPKRRICYLENNSVSSEFCTPRFRHWDKISHFSCSNHARSYTVLLISTDIMQSVNK